MKDLRFMMGMPITVEIIDPSARMDDIDQLFDFLTYVDETFSTYKESSEISRINAGTLSESDWSNDMREVFNACACTTQETQGFFNISRNGHLDPSGYVKGWAIQKAANLLAQRGFTNYYVEAGGDIQVAGKNSDHEPWSIGIRNPFNLTEIIKRLSLSNGGIATSGTSARGQHIYNPHNPDQEITDIVSVTVIGPKIVDADRYATAAFAMGTAGITFITSLPGFEGYQIDARGIATFTAGFNQFVSQI